LHAAGGGAFERRPKSGHAAGLAKPRSSRVAQNLRDPVEGPKNLMVEPGYRLAATGREAAEDERLGLLEQLYDPLSRRRRALLVEPGWCCLEVGGGRGSMAAWLAEQVGPTGQVVATDNDVGYLRRLELPNLEVVEHNILEDSLEVLRPGSFDLVCSRLTLFHLVGRQELAIRQMAACLRPGGWLIDEDADWGTAAPVDPSHPLYAAYHEAWRDGDWWTTRGYDKAFGRKLPVLFERCGLENIRHEASTEVVRGSSPWARWWAVTLEVINELGGGGAVESYQRELEVIADALADPSVWILRELLHACWGRRPIDAGQPNHLAREPAHPRA
jgi:ubiquinone/menaquinone biosynthesis C-methylase UbiE